MEISSLTIFTEVMQLGSYAAVARNRGVSASSISRTVSSLETELGIRLFQRSTRHLEPTEVGIIYYNRISQIILDLENAKLMAKDISEKATGNLRVSVPVVYGEKYIAPLLPEFSKQYPEISIDLIMSDSFIDLLAERIDVAVRLGSLSDSSYIAKRLSDMNFIVCASQKYLDENGVPVKPEMIKQHECLIFPRVGFNLDWQFKDSEGEVKSFAINGKYSINNSEVIRQCALSDMGVALLPDWLIAKDIESKKLVKLYTDYVVTPTDFNSAIWLLYPSKSYLPKKVRIFVDYMSDNIMREVESR